MKNTTSWSRSTLQQVPWPKLSKIVLNFMWSWSSDHQPQRNHTHICFCLTWLDINSDVAKTPFPNQSRNDTWSLFDQQESVHIRTSLAHHGCMVHPHAHPSPTGHITPTSQAFIHSHIIHIHGWNSAPSHCTIFSLSFCRHTWKVYLE